MRAERQGNSERRGFAGYSLFMFHSPLAEKVLIVERKFSEEHGPVLGTYPLKNIPLRVRTDNSDTAADYVNRRYAINLTRAFSRHLTDGTHDGVNRSHYKVGSVVMPLVFLTQTPFWDKFLKSIEGSVDTNLLDREITSMLNEERAVLKRVVEGVGYRTMWQRPND
ncbi:MAG: hypothetical protein NUV69_01655 [Candidatus Curtissbacteria bacterium]|nr:hypothetical protein [Candidatus Curtissbacteria bacterium]